MGFGFVIIMFGNAAWSMIESLSINLVDPIFQFSKKIILVKFGFFC